MQSRSRVVAIIVSCAIAHHLQAMDTDLLDDLMGQEQKAQVVDKAPSGAAPSDVLGWADSPHLSPDSKNLQQDVLENADVTTFNEARGNWFYKAKILKDARKVYDAIRKKLIKMAPLEDTYTAERTKIGEAVSTFYKEYGFQQGEVEERLAALMQDLKRLEDAEGELDPDEQALQQELQQKQAAVEEVKADFDNLTQLTMGLNQAMVTFAGQMNRVNAYDEQAWEYYEQIEATLSDELAEELFNKIKNSLENIGAIEKYLTTQFSAFFEKSQQAIASYTASIEQKVLALKAQGIGLGQKMAELLAKEEAVKRDQEQRELDRLKAELAAANKTWMSKVGDGIASLFGSFKQAVVGIFDWFASFFRGPKPVRSKKVPDQAPAVAELVDTESVVQDQTPIQRSEVPASVPVLSVPVLADTPAAIDMVVPVLDVVNIVQDPSPIQQPGVPASVPVLSSVPAPSDVPAEPSVAIDVVLPAVDAESVAQDQSSVQPEVPASEAAPSDAPTDPSEAIDMVASEVDVESVVQDQSPVQSPEVPVLPPDDSEDGPEMIDMAEQAASDQSDSLDIDTIDMDAIEE